MSLVLDTKMLPFEGELMTGVKIVVLCLQAGMIMIVPHIDYRTCWIDYIMKRQATRKNPICPYPDKTIPCSNSYQIYFNLKFAVTTHRHPLHMNSKRPSCRALMATQHGVFMLGTCFGVVAAVTISFLHMLSIMLNEGKQMMQCNAIM